MESDPGRFRVRRFESLEEERTSAQRDKRLRRGSTNAQEAAAAEAAQRIEDLDALVASLREQLSAAEARANAGEERAKAAEERAKAAEDSAANLQAQINTCGDEHKRPINGRDMMVFVTIYVLIIAIFSLSFIWSMYPYELVCEGLHQDW